jgi:hypothetical protein
VSLARREALIASCRSAVTHDLALIGATSFPDTIDICFVKTRHDMLRYTGMSSSGMAFPDRRTLFALANEKEAPIRHELMHMITMLKWGDPHPSSTWMNEGLAALADDNCNGFTDEQVYRFLQEKSMRIAIDSLAADFYRQPEMIAYHEAGFIVQHLIREYGIEKFRQVWARGFAAFDDVYGLPFQQVQESLDTRARSDFPQAPAIDWERFKEGCN